LLKKNIQKYIKKQIKRMKRGISYSQKGVKRVVSVF
jgi:hypothetical protein